MSKKLSEAHQKLKKLDHKIPQCREYYRHYKGGFYWCIGTGVHEATMTPMVAYRDLAIKYPDEALWFRDLDVWNQTVEGVPRFSLVTPLNVFQLESEAQRIASLIESGTPIKEAMKTLGAILDEDMRRVWEKVLERSLKL